MTHEDALKKIAEVLTPELRKFEIAIIEPKEKSFTLRIVCEAFIGMDYVRRWEMVNDLIEDYAKEVPDTYMFDFETFTPQEWKEIERGLKTKADAVSGGMAALQPTDLDDEHEDEQG